MYQRLGQELIVKLHAGPALCHLRALAVMRWETNALVHFRIQSISKPDITKRPLISKCYISPRVLNAFILSLYNQNTVVSKGYTGPLEFDITRVDCIT